MNYFLAIDIGASSGRHIVGWIDNGEIKTDEVFRFPNGVKKENGHLVWDIHALFDYVKQGISSAFKKYPKIESLAIDTWGVDYVLLKGDKEVLPCYAYRDDRTKLSVGQVHGIISFDYLYGRTGIQFQPFNTIYQLYDDKVKGRLDGVTDFLMIPEYLNYRLTGRTVKEYTNATTTGLVNKDVHEFDKGIIKNLDLPQCLFGDLCEGSTIVGKLTDEIAKEVGGQCEVKLCLSHDTASAVYAIEQDCPYISSGTWSLLGIRQDIAHTDKASLDANFSNEGGIGMSFRYQKNIMGMWIINRTCDENGVTPAQFAKVAEESDYQHFVDVNHADFMSPVSMTDTILHHLDAQNVPRPQSLGDLARCALLSLAKSYADSVRVLENAVGKQYDEIVIVGGGAKNKLLNELTEQCTGKKVIALPIEATAIGNLKIQIERTVIAQ